MLLPFVSVLLTVGIMWVLHRRASVHGRDSVAGCTPLFVFLALAGSIYGSFKLGHALPQTWVHSETVHLANPWKGEGCTAPLLLVIEHPTGEANYLWYEEGLYHPDRVWRSAADAHHTEVIEDEAQETGELRLFRAQFTENPILGWFALSSRPMRYEFHVPLGSVKRI